MAASTNPPSILESVAQSPSKKKHPLLARREAISLLLGGGVASLAGCAGGPSAGELFDLSAAGEGTGLQFVGVVRAIKIASTYRATESQRVAALRVVARAASPPPPKATPKPSPPPREPEPVVAAKKPDPLPQPAKKLPKLVSVEVPKAPDEPEAKKAAHDIVVVNTVTRQLVGNTVYVTNDLPKRNETVKINSLTVQHLGMTF